MANFIVSQLVKVIDQSSVHHDLIRSVIVVTPQNGGVFYWLRFDSTLDGGQFREEQLEAIACSGSTGQ